MATAITIGEQSEMKASAAPECAHAPHCNWFETKGVTSCACTNRESMVCPKKRADIFAPHDRDFCTEN